jgi:hypothetical protein
MDKGARLLMPRVLKALYEISMTSNCPLKKRKKKKKKEEERRRRRKKKKKEKKTKG